MMDRSRYAALFLSESREHLNTCNQLLLEWERDPKASEPVTGIFRAMHTLKGMAGAMGFTNLTELAHRAETLLDILRSAPAASIEFHDLLFRVVDALESGVSEAVAGGDERLDFRALLAELGDVTASSPTTGSWAVGSLTRVEEPAGPGAGRVVRVTIRPDAPMRGARALLALRRAEALGKVTAVRPAPSAFEHEEFDGRFSFRLESETPDQAVVEAISSVGDVASVTFGEEAATASAGTTGGTAGRARQIRVDLARLDALMNQIGELVVAKGRLAELLTGDGSPELQAVSARIGRVVGEMQAEIIQARMTPVWQVFDRFPRVVRDLSRQLGKRIAFQVEGEEIELDRALLDEIGDPLLHLLRNAVDHGIEAPAERKQLGKPPEGRIVLSASRDRSAVAIQVSDDGRGIDRNRILAKAIKEGVIEKGTASLTDDQLLRVLARPGFTTAKSVTDVSGRGVGMDAVVSRLRGLGGSLQFETTVGKGTTFTLRIPSTLAILRALLARVGSERYAVPLASVAETVEYVSSAVVSLHGKEALVLRDLVIPTVHLRERVGAEGSRPPGRPPTLILEVGGQRAALVVDALVGQQEVVVEAFDGPSGMLPIFSGATILGDGEPVLILDPAALV